MTISCRVQKQFFASAASEELIRLPPTVITQYQAKDATKTRSPEGGASQKMRRRTNLWTVEEHERFLAGLELFPQGPWKEISAIVGTKTTRQTMTHAQKYRQKIERHARGHAVKSKKAPFAAKPSWDLPAQAMHSAKVEPVSLPCANSPLDIAIDLLDPLILEQDIDSFFDGLDAFMPYEAVYSF